MKYTSLILSGLTLSILMFSGCSMKNETIREPLQENITTTDIEIYQDLKNNKVGVVDLKEKLRLTFKKTFQRLDEVTKNTDEKLSERNSDRFSNVLASFKEGQ